MDSNTVQFYGMIITSLVGIASIIISVLTLMQNSKMIEESTRPVISIYGTTTNFGAEQRFYFVIKNFGQTPTTITKFFSDYDFSFNQAYTSANDHDWLSNLNGAHLAPGQSKICALNYKNINKPVTFTLEHKTTSKTYNEQIKVDLKAGAAMLVWKSDAISEKDELRNISYTLQEFIQKNL
ncbi:hypothetical protein [Clostridium sp. HBUAS56010]|uniref:hypothetical protein n=1 Tax=Clostridium sp. HBUAS56010 TaxID=2571127 RepID=UPI001178BDA8|nr:hypothetical protein [Clostridium sp. HBUAS56010]